MSLRLKGMFGLLAIGAILVTSTAFAELQPSSARDSLFNKNMEKISCEVERIQIECRSLNADSVARKTTVTLSVSVQGDSARYAPWSGLITREKIDTLRSEQAGIPIQNFLPAQKSVRRGLWRWTEPALVLVTLSGLVYMFYSVRSR